MKARRVVLTLMLAFVAALLLAGCASDMPSVFRPESKGADDIRNASIIMFAILSVVFLTVWGLLLYILLRFRRRPESEVSQTHGNLRIEIVWTVIPAIIVAALFYLTIDVTGRLMVPNTGLGVTVTGYQWWWGVEYPDGEFVTANEIHVPVDRDVTATLLAKDVIHSYWVPQMGGKLDMVPGHVNVLTFVPQTIGTYIGQCSEFCGHQHGNMRFLLVVESVEDFSAWFANETKPAAAPATAAARAGSEALGTLPCGGCHTVRGTPLRGVSGPDLTHFGSRSGIAALTLENTSENLREWLRDPQAVKPGNLMPRVPLTAQRLDQLVAYLEGLK